LAGVLDYLTFWQEQKFFEKVIGEKCLVTSGGNWSFNSLTAIDAHEWQRFNKLRGAVVSCRIFILS
jgi:hypothetical protein